MLKNGLKLKVLQTYISFPLSYSNLMNFMNIHKKSKHKKKEQHQQQQEIELQEKLHVESLFYITIYQSVVNAILNIEKDLRELTDLKVI